MNSSKDRTLAGIIFVAAAAIVVAVGWFTGLREVMYEVLAVVGWIVFLPVILIIAGVLISMVLAIVTDGAGEALIDLGAATLGPYYRFLAFVLRHPAGFAIFAGVLTGCLALSGILNTVVVRGENNTAQSMEFAQKELAAQCANSDLPAPVEGNRLASKFLSETHAGHNVAVDGFGRPFIYETKQGALGTTSYRLKSLGFDAVPSRDDLCVADTCNPSRAHRIVDKAARIVAKLPQKTIPSKFTEKLKALAPLQCPDR